MVTPDDRVKIVDFGLAKAAGDDESSMAAHTQTQTADGLIIGTVPYMSPEQARGGKADFRSDQFALGVMLFEMATATHPFQRETSVQTLSAIIAEDPPDPAQATPPVPFALRLLLRRLLAKNPRERFQHTADLAAELRTTRELLTEVTSAVSTPVVLPRSIWPRRIAAMALIAAAGVVAGRVVAPVESRASFDRFVPFATDAGYQGVAAWSPDGRTLAYEAEIDGVVQIFTRALGSPMRTQITRSAFDCFSPFWSSDGRHIYYHSLARDTDALWQVSPAGGAPDVVIEGATRAHVSPDGRSAMFLRQEPLQTNMTLWTVSLPDGTPERYARGPLADQTFAGGHLRFSPDGTKVMAWLGSGHRQLLGDTAADRRAPQPAAKRGGGRPSAAEFHLASGQSPPRRHPLRRPVPRHASLAGGHADRRRHPADDDVAQRELTEPVARRTHPGVRFTGHGFRSRGSAHGRHRAPAVPQQHA